jgi:protein-S-isoprenylcysteine O-methyltransferase Ste14
MNIMGKSTINPFLFFSGKISGYILWTMLALNLLNIPTIPGIQIAALAIPSLILLVVGMGWALVGLGHLGKSTRFGLPVESTKFKTKGLYRLSRNPIYLGFFCITLSAILNHVNVIAIILGVYSTIVYHLIILGEERFLEQRFGEEYKMYKSRVRRYLSV